MSDPFYHAMNGLMCSLEDGNPDDVDEYVDDVFQMGCEELRELFLIESVRPKNDVYLSNDDGWELKLRDGRIYCLTLQAAR